MGSSPAEEPIGLTAFQLEVLTVMARLEPGLFLTGGGALAGFYLHHRRTDDLDLFTTDPEAFPRARRALAEAGASLGAAVEIRQDSPGFVRAAFVRGADMVVVDLVLERVPQVFGEKRLVGEVRLDPIEEILANKLTAVVGRMEERDLVDLYALERSGLDAEAALDAAAAKDGGCTPATLAWLLSQVDIPDGAQLPGGVPAAELRRYVGELVVRLRRRAHPG